MGCCRVNMDMLFLQLNNHIGQNLLVCQAMLQFDLSNFIAAGLQDMGDEVNGGRRHMPPPWRQRVLPPTGQFCRGILQVTKGTYRRAAVMQVACMPPPSAGNVGVS